MEMDFYTAVDDLKSNEDDPGAGMLGVVGYNSACFYRYAVLDIDQLLANLGGDAELAHKAIEAFLKASALAIPTGKQNSFAAHSRPDFICAVLRGKGAPLSLVNAFVSPARPAGDTDLTQASVEKLAAYWDRIAEVYGDGESTTGLFCGTTLPASAPSGWQHVASLDALVQSVLQAVQKGI
jgi:CRISPR system Cascade subunit CasC